MDAALDNLMVEWDAQAELQKADLVRRVRELADDGDLAGLADLATSSDAAALLLADAMTELAHWAADIAAQENGGAPVEPEDGMLAEVAIVTAAALAAELAVSASRAALQAIGTGQTPAQVADRVSEYLAELSDAGARRQLGGNLHGAINAARLATFEAGPVGSLYAHEVNDRNTCVAPDVVVTTRRGGIRADAVTTTDEILTHTGSWVSPSQITISRVDEELIVAVLSDGRRLRVTDDHPILVLDGDVLVWCEAGDLAVDMLVIGQASLQGNGKLVIPDLRLGDAPHDVASINEISGLASVDMRAQGVPVASVRLDDQAVIDQKVHDPRANLCLCCEMQGGLLQSQANNAFDAGLQPARHVAARRTVAAILRASGDGAEYGRALLAGDMDGRAATGFAAVSADRSLSVTECCSATSADCVSPTSREGAGARAVAVSIGGRYRDGELRRAVRADLIDPLAGRSHLGQDFGVGEFAGHRAVDAAGAISARDLSVADLAEASRHPASTPAFKGRMGFAADAAGDQDATVHTRSIHELSVLKVTSVGRTPYCGFVYDFTIPGDETFWAEGILVHNCVPCSQVNGRFLGTTEQIETVWLSYPEGAYGGYVLCQGGPACRGTVFGVWREGAA